MGKENSLVLLQPQLGCLQLVRIRGRSAVHFVLECMKVSDTKAYGKINH
jgi:hypothetical protein